jgi:hypothetical protein
MTAKVTGANNEINMFLKGLKIPKAKKPNMAT